MTKYNVALIGLGKMGQQWIQPIVNNKDVNCVAYIESNSNLLTEVARKYKLHTKNLYLSLEEAMAVKKIDFIIDVTPPSTRLEHPIMALENNIHVLSEKPLAEDLNQAKKLLKKVKDSGLNYMVSQDYRFNPIPRSIKKYLNQKLIGEIGFIEISFFRNTSFEEGNFRINMDYPLLLDMSIHHLDLLRYFTDRKPVDLSTYAFNTKWSKFNGPSSHVMFMDFMDFKVSYNASWSSKGFQTSRAGNWRFDGSEGSILWENDSLFHITEKDKEMFIKRLDTSEVSLCAQEYVLSEFISALRDRRAPQCNIEDNIQTLELSLKAIDSARNMLVKS